VVIVVALAASTTTGTASAGMTTASVAQREVVSLLNDVRGDHGLRPLVLRGTLTKAARAHARDMVDRDYFEHNTLNGLSWDARVRRLIGGQHTLGENIGWGTFDRGTPAAIVGAWMNSAPHRRNILDPTFRLVGVGMATGEFLGQGHARVYVTDFGG
jgi:uncharacterized protein YkwD